MRQHRSDRNAHVRDQRVAELLADLEPTVADELHQQALQWHADDGTAVDVALAWLIRSHSPARVTASPGKGRQHLSLLQRYGDDRRLPVEVLGDPGQTYDRNPDVFGGVLDALHSAGDVVPYRDDMERMFGESFADVRVALDRREALSGFDAGAVTHGRAIAFASSRPSRQLVAHELAHVLQARRAGVVHGLRGISSASDTAEREADSIASRVSAGGIVGGALAVRAAPSAALHFGPPDADKKKKKDEPEDLSLGDKNFEIRGESVALKTAWLAKDDKLVPTASRMRAPTKIAEILKAFKTEGIFYWLRDDEIPRIADDLRIAGPLPEEKAFKVTLAPSVFELIGPPPDAAMEWRRWEKGLYAVISTKYLKKLPGIKKGKVKVGEAFTKKLLSTLEASTKLSLTERMRTELPKRFSTTLEIKDLAKGVLFPLTHKQLRNIYGKDDDGKYRWDAWMEDNKTGGVSGGSSAMTGGVTFDPNVGIEDREFYLSFMKKLGGGGGSAPKHAISKYLIDELKKIKGHKHEKDIMAALKKGGGASAGLTADGIQKMIEAIEIKKAKGASKMPERKGAKGKKPRFDELVRGRIVNQASRLWPGKAARFDFELQNKRTARELYLLFEITYTDIDWWAHPVDNPKMVVDKERTVSKYGDPDRFNAKFPNNGEYLVHAVVHHTWYRAAHFEERVLVKSEKAWLHDQEGDAFKGMGKFGRGKKDFETGWFNEWFGADKNEYGTVMTGTLPKDFKRKSFAERTRFIQVERNRMKKLIATYGKSGFSGHTKIVKYARDYLETLAKAETNLGNMKKEGYKFFETRGTFLSNKPGKPDTHLHLLGAAKLSDGQPPKYTVKIEDFSQVAEPETLHFSATASTLKGAMEEAFVDLCKSYPPGRVSVMAELMDDTLSKSSGKTLGFQLYSGTAWKSVKATLWDPTVKIVVNIAGAALMIFLPVTAPVVFPLLAAYNITDTVDTLLDKHRKGILDGKDIALGVMEIGMNVLPYVGQARALGSLGKTAMFVIDGIEIGTDIVMMTMQGLDQLRTLRDQQISEIAKEYEWVQTTEKTNPSHPDLGKRKKALEKKIETTRNLGKTMFTQMAFEGAIMLASPVAFNHMAGRAQRSSAKALVDNKMWIHKEGVQPTYDPKSGKIVGDKKNHSPAKLNKAVAAMEKDLLANQARYAKILGTDGQRVSILREGDSLEVARFSNDEYVVRVPKDIDPAQVDLFLKRRVKEGIKVRTGKEGAGFRDKTATGKTGPAVPGRTEPSYNVHHITHGHNHIVGDPIGSKAAGTNLLQRLAGGDADALRTIGLNPPKKFDPSTVEWGLGYNKAKKEYVLVRGEPDAVDWGPFPDLVGVAHSHPFRESRRLKGTGAKGQGVHINKIAKGGGHNSGNQTKVFPSAADIAYAARNDLANHDVHTPYVHRGNGIVGNPKSHKKPGSEPTLSFSIKNAELAGRMTGTEIPAYKAKLIAHSNGKIIWEGDVWAIHHPTIGSLLHQGSKPPGKLIDTNTKATTPAKGKTAAGDDLPKATTPEEHQALADWQRLENDTSRDYKGKFKFSLDDWMAHYREGWHFDFDASTRNPWRKADAKKVKPPKYFGKRTSANAVYRALTKKGTSFREYGAMLRKLGIVKRKQDILDAIDDIKFAGKSHDYVRHQLKVRFHDQVVAKLANPKRAELKAKYPDESTYPWSTNPDEAYNRAAHAQMLEHTRGLNSSDKGNLTEDWYVARYGSSGGKPPERHVPIDKADHPGAHMTDDRVADMLGVPDPTKIQNDRIGEIKSTDSKLSKKDMAQFHDYMKFVAAGNKLTVKGKKVKIKGVRYVFTSPKGAKANRVFIEENLTRPDGIEVTFEIFTKNGQRHIIKKPSDITPEIKAEWDS